MKDNLDFTVCTPAARRRGSPVAVLGSLRVTCAVIVLSDQ